MTQENYSPHLHAHVTCDAYCKNVAEVWYESSKETLAFCSHHATVHELPLVQQGYIILKDFRPKTREELRRKLLEPAPTVEELLIFERLKNPRAIF